MPTTVSITAWKYFHGCYIQQKKDRVLIAMRYNKQDLQNRYKTSGQYILWFNYSMFLKRPDGSLPAGHESNSWEGPEPLSKDTIDIQVSKSDGIKNVRLEPRSV